MSDGETRSQRSRSSQRLRPKYHRVVAAVLHANGRVLLCHRRQDLTWHANVWDLPGGHVDDSETAESALARELNEELGIHVRPPDWAPEVSTEVGEDTHITVWAISEWDGDVANCAQRNTTDSIGSMRSICKPSTLLMPPSLTYASVFSTAPETILLRHDFRARDHRRPVTDLPDGSGRTNRSAWHLVCDPTPLMRPTTRIGLGGRSCPANEQ